MNITQIHRLSVVWGEMTNQERRGYQAVMEIKISLRRRALPREADFPPGLSWLEKITFLAGGVLFLAENRILRAIFAI